MSSRHQYPESRPSADHLPHHITLVDTAYKQQLSGSSQKTIVKQLLTINTTIRRNWASQVMVFVAKLVDRYIQKIM